MKYGAVRRTLGLSKAAWLIPDIAILVDEYLQPNAALARQILLLDIYVHSLSHPDDSDSDFDIPGLIEAAPSDDDMPALSSDDDDDDMPTLVPIPDDLR